MVPDGQTGDSRAGDGWLQSPVSLQLCCGRIQRVGTGRPLANQVKTGARVKPDERRAHVRRDHRTPIGFDTNLHKNRVGITVNVSKSGVAFFSPIPFSAGQEIKLIFRDPERSELERVGHVVRARPKPGSHALFAYVVAVQFDSAAAAA